MANLVPLTIPIDERLLDAVRLRAQKEGTSLAEVISGILSKALTAEVQEGCGVQTLAQAIQNVMKEQPKT